MGFRTENFRTTAAHYGDNVMNKFMLSFVLPVVITTTWFPLFDARAEVVPLRDWAPVIATQLMTVSFVEEEVKPDVPDLAPNEDPDKCPCKGTGKITHGDGHQTDCPFHGNRASTTSKKEFISPDEIKRMSKKNLRELVNRWKNNELEITSSSDAELPVCPLTAEEGPAHKCKCDTAETYCNCKEVHGKCSCAARDPATKSQDSDEPQRRNRSSRLFRGRT